jgi:hypothetical protein
MTDVMLALANAKPGHAGGFAQWFEDERAPALLGVDGVLGVRRLHAANDLADGPEHPYEFLAIYEIASGELASTAARMAETDATTSADQQGESVSWWYEEFRPRVATPDAGTGPFDHMVVVSNATPGADAELNRWYDEVHIPDIFNKIGGIVAARRYRRAEVPGNRDCPFGYMALYDIPEGQIAYCQRRLLWSRGEREEALAAGREPAVPITPAIGDDRMTWMYGSVTSAVEAAR